MIYLKGGAVPAGATLVVSLATVPCFVGSELIVGDGTNPSTLTVNPGVTLPFNASTLHVRNASPLIVDGSGGGITFTSATASKGTWGIFFQAGSGGTLKGATIQYAGQNLGWGSFGVRVDSSALSTWSYVTLSDNSGTGLLVSGSGSVSMQHSNFENGPAAGVTNNGSGSNADATLSYWNGASGPFTSNNNSQCNSSSVPACTDDSIIGSDTTIGTNIANGVSYGGFVGSAN